jgi:tRNA uridine 5-carbamoylmethylation protein Kti12
VSVFGESVSNTTFSEEMIEELYGRMEVPNARNRWDSPLFV